MMRSLLVKKEKKQSQLRKSKIISLFSKTKICFGLFVNFNKKVIDE